MNLAAVVALKAYGTTEGVTKAWDTRGRGRHASLDPKQQFQNLKVKWAKVNNDLLKYVDAPNSPEALQKLAAMRDISKQIHHIDIDPGGTAGIGLPGGPKDVAIIGAGPGGLAAAVMGATDGLDTTFIEAQAKVGGQSKFSSRIENYPGFPAGITGDKLAQNMYAQAVRLGADGKLGVRVTGMTYDPETGLKTLTLSNGETMQARSVIVAGGLEFRKLDFPGSDSKSVVYGDGQMLSKLAAGKTAVVLGGSNGAAQAALGTAQKADHVYILSRSPIEKGMSDYQVQQVRNNPKITIIENDTVGKLFTDRYGNATHLETTGGRDLDAEAVGVFLGSSPNLGWLPKDMALEGGKVKVDQNLESNIPGVFAVGDNRVGSIGRVGAAVGDGQMAEHAVFGYFDKLKEREKSKTSTTQAAATPDVHDWWDNIIDVAFALDVKQPYFSTMKASGTSEGVKKEWDTRGRGRKQDEYQINPPKFTYETGKPLKVIGYHNSNGPDQLKMGRRGIFFAEAPAPDYGDWTHRAKLGMKNPIVAEEQVALAEHLWPDKAQMPKDINDVLYHSNMEDFGNQNWWGTLDRGIAAEVQKRGYDGIVYTDPEALSGREFVVFKMPDTKGQFVGKTDNWIKQYPEEAKATAWAKYRKEQKDSNSMDLDASFLKRYEGRHRRKAVKLMHKHNLMGVGTTEGVKKAWDTRGRGKKASAKKPTRQDVKNVVSKYAALGDALDKAHRKLTNPVETKSLLGKTLHILKEVGTWLEAGTALAGVHSVLSHVAGAASSSPLLLNTLTWVHQQLLPVIAHTASTMQFSADEIMAASQFGNTGWQYGRSIARSVGYVPSRTYGGYPTAGGHRGSAHKGTGTMGQPHVAQHHAPKGPSVHKANPSGRAGFNVRVPNPSLHRLENSGTSEGVKKEWDERGRGRKAAQPAVMFPYKLYRGTTTRNLKEILQKGIEPAARRMDVTNTITHGQAHPLKGNTYITYRKDLAKNYAEFKQKYNEAEPGETFNYMIPWTKPADAPPPIMGTKPVIITMSIPSSVAGRLKEDPESPSSLDSFSFKGKIPKQYIEDVEVKNGDNWEHMDWKKGFAAAGIKKQVFLVLDDVSQLHKRTLQADIGGEPMTGNMGHVHIDPVAWFHPPSLLKRRSNESLRVPTDDPGESKDTFLDKTKRDDPETQEFRMKLLKKKRSRWATSADTGEDDFDQSPHGKLHAKWSDRAVRGGRSQAVG